MKRATQLGLGLVASPVKRLTPSQLELQRRSGTHLSIQQQIAARRRARADEAQDQAAKLPSGISDSRINRGLRPAGASARDWLASLKRDGQA